jgi:CDP-diacylglycerol--glycerol-3-phosphate 3-phosphatidyltransferase
MTTANKITIFRILLLPFFIYQLLSYWETGAEWDRILGVAAFGMAAVLDGVDGFVARRFHQRSELGAVLDPLADKLLLVSAVIVLSLDHPHFDRIPLWLTLTILSRDVLLLIGFGVIYWLCGAVQVRPRWTGKVATVLQMAVVIWTLLKLGITGREWLAGSATVMTAISAIQYVLDGVRQLGRSPRSAATPGQ